MQLDPGLLPVTERQNWLYHIIAPRPLVIVSTIDKNGKPGLWPFSLFNLFSTNPPIIIFSPTNRLSDGGIKRILQNLMDVPEAVVHIVEEDIIHQVNISMYEFSADADKFGKTGFTPIASTIVKPPMIKECRIKIECRVEEIKALGHEKGAGNLVICEILRIHIDDGFIDENGKVDERKINLVARLGGNLYCRYKHDDIFVIEKPMHDMIGFNGLPADIRKSAEFTRKQLAMLASVEQIPELNEFNPAIIEELAGNSDARELTEIIHRYAAELLDKGELDKAWQLLLNEKKYLGQKNND